MNNCCSPDDPNERVMFVNNKWHTTSCTYAQSEKMRVFFEPEQVSSMDRCECGAKHTSFPNHHYRWCKMYEEKYYK